MTFNECFKRKQNFKRGLVKAELDVTEDEATLTLSVNPTTETRLRESYERVAEKLSHKEWGVSDADKYADSHIETDKKEAEISAKEWVDEQLSLKNIKNKKKIVIWAKE